MIQLVAQNLVNLIQTLVFGLKLIYETENYK